ncbi:MAG: UvrD-helicase domain-containing protein [Chitinophagaceae bacterium]
MEQQFDVMQAQLRGSNLIEASAGTGKTFSIAVLVLRLLLRRYGDEEKDAVSVNQILMVTFTTAAVAELESRIRKYVYLAAQYASANANDKEEIREELPMIAAIVDKAMAYANQSNRVGEVQQTLKDNLLLLDESNVMTIHSFCQSTLNEFAMETNQLFGVELFTESDKLIETELNRFWRKHITTLDMDIIRTLDLEKKRTELRELVTAHLGGKHYAFYETEKDYSLTNLNEHWHAILTLLELEKEMAFKEIESLFYALPIADSINASGAVKKSKEKYLTVLDNLSAFIEVYSDDGSKVKDALPEELKTLIDDFIAKYGNIESYSQRLFFKEVNCLAIQEITNGYRQFLSANNFVTYDDLIGKLHKAVSNENPYAPHLKQKLNEKYKAVFVDEFQDTDRQQYDIFFETFAQQGILFLIGDPKQSIYGWRKADMQTYFKARESVDTVYQMNINYRSSKTAIVEMNRFFKPSEDFDTFYFQDKKERIDYIKVAAPEDSTKGCFTYAQEPCSGMKLYEATNKSILPDAVAALTLQLLSDKNYRLKDREISPADIGILVRTNAQAMQIKTALSAKNIPSVVVNEDKVLQSEEAYAMLYLLQAVDRPSLSKINRFLMSRLLGYGYQQLLLVDDNKVLDCFQELHATWTANGTYPMLFQFANMFTLEEKWTEKTDGERVLTNFFHITELLHRMEKRNNFSPEELIVWLRRSIDGQERVGDEYELRMESDDNAVKIVTIHKSKGLEYNIVLAPYLDLDVSMNKKNYLQFYDSSKEEYVTKDTLLLSPNEKRDYRIEQERENRRLIYVAITRAAYQFCVFHSKREKESSIAPFYRAIGADEVEDIDNIFSEEYSTYRPAIPSRNNYILEAKNFQLKETDWHKLSFTGLSFHGETTIKQRATQFENDYDAFVFNQLRFGAASGNMLHSLLENIDFTTDERHGKVVSDILKKYIPNAAEIVAPNIQQLLKHVLNVPIQVGDTSLQLNQIPSYKRLSELEFDFPIHGFDYKKLSYILKEDYPVQTRSFDSTAVQGLMNGKVDLLFEHDGKYFILDWKSNYLGFQLQDYNKDGVLNAMNENNYHLQYLLYIVAVKKFLESRLSYFNYEKQFGGVVYLFLRGVREDSDTGIFTAKPPYKTIAMLERLLHKANVES